jgi:hypothetical protein
MPQPRDPDLGAIGDRRSDQAGALASVASLAGDVHADEVLRQAAREVSGFPAVVVGVELDDRAVSEPDMPGVHAAVRPVEVQEIDDALVGALANLPERLDLLAGASAGRAVLGVRVNPTADPAARTGNTLAGQGDGRGGHDRTPRSRSASPIPRDSRHEPPPGAASVRVVLAGTRQPGQRPSTTPAE